jgi:hypothetical protein
MSSKALAETERVALELILEDLRYLFDREEIRREEVDDVLRSLKSDEVKSYIQSLRFGSKPETALRESFIAGKSVLLKYLFGEALPEVRSNGFIDYLIKDEMGRGIALELKPLFEADVEFDKAGKPIFKRLRQKKIVPEIYREQILKYIQEGEAQFVILTNLKDWFFYSKELTPREVKPFCTISFFDFVREYDVIGNLRDYLERKEFESIRYDLDKWFLESLKTWVKKLSEVEFTVDDKRKLELIIGLINKFIFVQTLDDYGVIEFNWIKKRWNYHEQMWQRKGKLMVLEKFFDELDDWFYLYYDTELFKEKILPHIKKDEENIEKLYRNLQLVLGLTYLQVPFGALKGIMQYNFRYIDEDVLGKAYETFLAEVRKEEGVYYTPKYITQYIAENTVGKIFDETLAKIKGCIENGDYEKVKELVERFISIRVLDPACGSGSFLIKAIRIVVKKYKELIQLIGDCIKKYSNYAGTLDLPHENRRKLELLHEIKEIIGPENDRELIAKILVRHIHGVDLDKRALEVAKVNIWLEAIKLAPKEFRYDKLPPETNYILPNLEMNLCNGDSLVGLPEGFTIKYLYDKHRDALTKLSALRTKYLENPTNPTIIEEISNIKCKIRDELDNRFIEYLGNNKISTQIVNQTKPVHWALSFWYVYFDMNGNPLDRNVAGFSVIVGNPPYFTIRGKGAGALKRTFYYEYLQTAPFWKEVFRSQSDIYYYFIMKSVELLRINGKFGFIIENYWIENDYADRMKSLLLENTALEALIHFGNVKIFEDAGNDTCILFFKKIDGAISTREEYKLKVVFCKETMEGASQYEQNRKLMEHIIENIDRESYSDAYIDVFWVSSKTLNTGKWVLSTKKGILEKIKENGRDIFPLKKIAIVAQGMSPGAKEVFALSEDEIEKYKIENEVLKPLITNSEIFRYFIKPVRRKIIYPYYVQNLEKFPFLKKYLETKKHLLIAGPDRQRLLKKGKIRWFDYSVYRNREIYEKEKIKIVCPYRAKENTFALDEEGFFGTTDMYAILPKKNSDLDIRYLLALLNSKLLTFWYAEAGKRKGAMLEYFTTPLERIVIKQVSNDKQQPLIKLVQRIIAIKKANYNFLQIWREWCTRLKNNEYSLHNILSEDARFMRTGEFDKAWTLKVTFYPTEHEMPNIILSKFKVAGETDENVIKITGLDENNKEKFVYKMEFGSRDLMLHVYCCILEALQSRAEIKNFSQLLTKTAIPIIKEVNRNLNESTPNIIKKVKDEFKDWLRQNKIENVEADIVKIDNEIEELEAKIDALVFKLYGLEESEIKVVFDSLKTPTIYQYKVFEFFRKL